MLDPEYLRTITEGAEEIAAQLHENIVRRIVERIMARMDRGDDYILTAQDKWQLEVLQEAGVLMEDLQQEIARRSKMQIREIRKAFEDAGVRTLTYDNAIYEAAGLSPAGLRQSPYLLRLLQRGYEATSHEWRNFTRTTANRAQRLFIEVCDRAYHQVSTGALSSAQATREAVEAVAKDGVVITYPSGHKDTIETATARAVRTGVNQACGDITNARLEEMEWDIILVSAHLGARVTDNEDYTNHYWWQGQFYSRSGKDPRFPPYSVCGEGDVQGIHGANCRHSHGPGDGENNPFEKFDSEENKKAYELSQRQRYLERQIRKTKREVSALQTAIENANDPAAKAELETAYQKKAEKLRTQNKAYKDFCKEHDLKPLSERLHIAGWDRKKAAKASAAARQRPAPKKTKSNVSKPPAAKYEEITDSWYSEATPGSHEVEDLHDYVAPDGTRYGVDGKHVVLDYSPHEKEIAELLAKEVGGEIYMVPRVNHPQGISTPDYYFNGKAYDLKTVTGSGKKALFDRISKKKQQSDSFIFDLSDCPLDDSAISEQIRYIYSSKQTGFVDEIVIIKAGKIAQVFKRKKS